MNTHNLMAEIEPLNLENLKACGDYNNLVDEELNLILNDLKCFVEIIVSTYLKNNILIDNQQVIYLNNQKQEAA